VLIFRFATQSKAFLEAARGEVSDTLRQVFRGPELVHKLLQVRQNYREHITRILHRGLIVDTVEIAASWDKVADLHRAVEEALRGVEGVYFVTAHLSHIYRHGACLYFTILFMPSESLYFKIWDAVYSEAERFGATISHHHGTGVVKQRYLELEKPAELYRRLKAALDPKGILNPGRLVP
jgi:alkyldihydroxyacetonephosphate synthase